MYLSLILWLPLIAFPIAYLLGRIRGSLARWFTIIVTLADLVLSLYVWGFLFDQTKNEAFQLVEHYNWVPQAGISYYLGIDGLGIIMVVLTTFLSAMAAIASNHIKEREGLYYSLFLLMEGGLLGVFVSLDLFLFFIFWEIVLVPMFFLIGIWGGPRRKYAAIKFFIYTHVGSVVMLISFFYVYWVWGQATNMLSFNLLHLTGQEAYMGNATLPVESVISGDFTKLILFSALLFGFAIKVPVVPLHTWLPDAHVEAPSPISVILAGVLLKMGGYAIIRIAFPLLPTTAQTYALPVALIGLISIFYAGFVAIWQKDIKRLIAYSSISHMGLVIIGSAAATLGSALALTGAIYMMFAHGLINGLLFLISGVYKNHVHSRMIPDISGLTEKMPLTSGFFVYGAMGGLGLPGLAGFVAEFLIILGAFQYFVVIQQQWLIALVVFGAILNAAMFLWAIQRMIFGPQKKDVDYKDLCWPEIISFSILAIVILILGVYPPLLVNMVNRFVEAYTQLFPALP